MLLWASSVVTLAALPAALAASTEELLLLVVLLLSLLADEVAGEEDDDDRRCVVEAAALGDGDATVERAGGAGAGGCACTPLFSSMTGSTRGCILGSCLAWCCCCNGAALKGVISVEDLSSVRWDGQKPPIWQQYSCLALDQTAHCSVLVLQSMPPTLSNSVALGVMAAAHGSEKRQIVKVMSSMRKQQLPAATQMLVLPPPLPVL